MIKKNVGQLKGKDRDGNFLLSSETTADIPTVEEIVGSRDKSSLLQKIAKFSH
jgi:hypothetical protein